MVLDNIKEFKLSLILFIFLALLGIFFKKNIFKKSVFLKCTINMVFSHFIYSFKIILSVVKAKRKDNLTGVI